jgi:rhodanese-related sulfurtransferase
VSGPESLPEIDVAELADRPDAPLIDVRRLDEYVAGHVPWARPIPLAEVPDRVSEIPRDEPVYVICAVGARSARAAEYLITQGIDAANVVGGTKAWIETGRPVETGDEPAE